MNMQSRLQKEEKSWTKDSLLQPLTTTILHFHNLRYQSQAKRDLRVSHVGFPSFSFPLCLHTGISHPGLHTCCPWLLPCYSTNLNFVLPQNTWGLHQNSSWTLNYMLLACYPEQMLASFLPAAKSLLEKSLPTTGTYLELPYWKGLIQQEAKADEKQFSYKGGIWYFYFCHMQL